MAARLEIAHRRAGLCLLAAIVAGGLPLAQPANVALAATPATGPSLQTPVLSLRREPDLLARAVAGIKLAAGLDAALTDPRQGAAGAQTCMVVSVGGMGVYSRRDSDPLIPASNLKLLTATAAVDKLGAGDHLITQVQAARPPVAGIVDGNLYLVGGGDPLLRTPDYVANLHYREQIYDDLNLLADRVKAAAVTRVTGGVVGDESRYDTQRYVPTWPARYGTTGEVGPLSALSVNDGYAAYKPSAVAAAQPAQQAASTFAGLLTQRGIAIGGGPASGTAPANATKIAQIDSPPLSDVAAEILRRSDNNGAELITKELGRQANRQTPTTAAGVAVITADLQAAGLPIGPLHMVDGSGLDRSDRASCQLLLAALLRSGPGGALGQGLAVAGQSGTLEHRLVGTIAAGRLHAKTGSLDGVSALTGFVMPVADAAGTAEVAPPPVAFSLMVNGLPGTKAGDAFEDRIAVLLAQFPQAPAASRLAPLPAAGGP